MCIYSKIIAFKYTDDLEMHNYEQKGKTIALF